MIQHVNRRYTIMLRSTFVFRWAVLLLLCVGASAQAPLGELFASDPGAPAVAQTAGTGMPVLPGSQLSAGISSATLKLARGGYVRICPQSQLSVDSGEQGLMLGMGAGGIEINYQVEGSRADLLATPDFNIRLAGPGSYHFAVGVSARGDTCFKPLPGNSAGIVFSEQLGSDMYAVAADETALFREGKLAGRTNMNGACGCPGSAVPSNVAEYPAPPSHPGDAHEPAQVHVATDRTTPEPPQPAGQKPITVDTPFVFSAGSTSLPGTVAKLEFSTLPNAFFAQDYPDPIVLSVKPPEAPAKEAKPESTPAPPKETEKKGFGARMRAFFGSIFHH